jgi:hypothetical protein
MSDNYEMGFREVCGEGGGHNNLCLVSVSII